MKICVRYHLSLKGEEAAVKYSWFYGFTLSLSRDLFIFLSLKKIVIIKMIKNCSINATNVFLTINEIHDILESSNLTTYLKKILWIFFSLVCHGFHILVEKWLLHWQLLFFIIFHFNFPQPLFFDETKNCATLRSEKHSNTF